MRSQVALAASPPGLPTATIGSAPVRASTAATAVSTANRQAMPIIARVVDQFREVFGADEVRVVYAEENGRKRGTLQPPGVKPVITGACALNRNPRRTVAPAITEGSRS